jgi:hypothetical protein
MLPYGPWRPDVGGPLSGFAKTAEGVVPKKVASGLGYGPFPRLVTAAGAEALPGTPRGNLSLQVPGSGWKQYFATDTTIEEMAADYSWTSIDTGRTPPAGDDVSFCQFGSFLLNSDTVDGYCAYNIVAPAGNNAVSGAPAARSLFTCSNVVFALDCDGNNRRMKSTDIGRYDVFDKGAADGKVFETGGALIGGRDLSNGVALIWQEQSIRVVQFGSGPSTYALTPLTGNRGAVADRTIVAMDQRAFWWDTTGPWMFAGGAPAPIGENKINVWAADNIGASNYGSLQGTIDPSRNLVGWRLDATKILLYNWVEEEFSIVKATTTAIAKLATSAITIGDLTGTIGSYTVPFGNRLWQGSAPLLGGLDADMKFATFSGANMGVTLETCVMNSPTQDLITLATPADDCAVGTLAMGTADSFDEAVTYAAGEPRQPARGGATNQRGRGSNISFKRQIDPEATWTYIEGVDHINGEGK